MNSTTTPRSLLCADTFLLLNSGYDNNNRFKAFIVLLDNVLIETSRNNVDMLDLSKSVLELKEKSNISSRIIRVIYSDSSY